MTPDIYGLIMTRSEKLGTIQITKDKLTFETHYRKSSGQVNRAALIDMGDIVYFMLVDGELKKIGKAAGKEGWYSRMNEYGKTRFNKVGKDTWDATTRKIYNHMTRNYEDHNRKIDVYAVRAPREVISIMNPLTGLSMMTAVETAGAIEQSFIQIAYQQGYTLDFCREKETSK
jgi:hypothetical protein